MCLPSLAAAILGAAGASPAQAQLLSGLLGGGGEGGLIGLSGGTAGPTHSGLEDLGVMRMMPGMTVVAPSGNVLPDECTPQSGVSGSPDNDVAVTT